MNEIQFLTLYLSGGLLTLMWIVLYPLSYLKILKHSLLILNLVKLKRKSNESKVLKTEDYSKELDNKIVDENIKNEDPVKRNFNLIMILFAFPFIYFIIILAYLLKFFYLDTDDLKNID